MMQTFLPYPEFERTASVLDRQRLGKQRVEAWQILKANANTSGGWKNHPATLMWRGFEHALCDYGIAMCNEWIKQGFKDTLRLRFQTLRGTIEPSGTPRWVYNPQLSVSHQSNLVRKLPEHYRKFFPDVPDYLPYVWPGAINSKSALSIDLFENIKEIS
jgi:hypothetical protein